MVYGYGRLTGMLKEVGLCALAIKHCSHESKLITAYCKQAYMGGAGSHDPYRLATEEKGKIT